ncbi:MAG: isochorismatase family protein [Bryobacteraceae bacterium]|nr:isochorismatase family protein [Bryobacteraceae bacterium]
MNNGNGAAPPLCDAERSVLLLVDIQQRLAAAMAGDARAAVIRNAGILAESAGRLGVPVFVSEQYPKGLGTTEPDLERRLGAGLTRVEKTSFSCCGDDEFLTALRELKRPQVVLAGMEAHVCVLQTAMGLCAAGFQVQVVEDATCSRNPDHRRIAMDRLRQAGMIVTNTESVVFEWLRDARHPEFKAIAARLR